MSAEADPKTSATAPQELPRPEGPKRFPPPELRLHDRKAFVGFGHTPLGDGLALTDLALIVPDVTFPFDITGGAATRYQRKKCRFGYLELKVESDVINGAVAQIQKACATQVASLSLELRADLIEGKGTLHGADAPVPFTFRVGFEPHGSQLLALIFDVRLYGPSPLPAAGLASLLARATVRSGVLPGAEPHGACGISCAPVPALLRKAVPLRGYRLPEIDDARLTRTDVREGALLLHFAAGGAPPPGTFDEDLLLTIEGMRAFAQGEELLAEGRYADAERYYVEKAEAPEAHPFAQERLVGLLASRSDAHDLALDVAAMLRERRPGAAAPYWAEAQIRIQRGQRRRAGELLQKLGELARQRGHTASWFHASRAAGEAFGQEHAHAASRALQDALAARPDDFESLRRLAEVADLAKDFEGAIRAWRRIAALAREPAQAARAHVKLGELLIRFDEDVAGARMHLDAALRLDPDDPEALLAMGELCAREGEFLRAIRCLDRVREEGINRGDAALTSRASLRAGRIWDEQVGHVANALLRLQEAADLAPNDVETQYRLGDLYERNERPAEAVEAYLKAVACARAAPLTDDGRALAHKALHALSKLALERLDDAPSAQAHLEAALALRPDDVEALRALIPVYRRSQRHAELAGACERFAAATLDPVERAALLAEAGELHRERLQNPDEARRLLELSLLSDPQNRTALEGLALLAAARGDGAALCRHLLRQLELARDDEESAALLRRLLHAAREVAGDLDLAADALGRLTALEPHDVALLEDLCALQRRRGDPAALASALERLASFQESEGRPEQAARALRERALLLESRLSRPLDALELLERALRLAPGDREVLKELAEASLRNGRPAAAREALRRLERDPTGGERLWIQARLGRAADLLGERDEAIAAWLEASAGGALDEQLLARLDALLAQSGRERERAELLFRRAGAQLDAGRPDAAAGLFSAAASLFVRVNRPQEAQDAFEAALEADRDGPYAPAALDALLDFSLRAENPLRAASLLARRAAFDATPREASRRLFHAAALVAELDAEKREGLLAQAVERDGTFAPARLGLARLRQASGEHAQALAHAEAALAAAANDPDAPNGAERVALHRLAAETARRTGDDAALRRHLAAWCEANPRDTEALLELAGLHRAAGDRHALLEVLRVLSDSGERRHAEPALRELAPLLDGEPARQAEALAAWRRLGRLAPKDPAVLTGLAAALGRAGEGQERARVLLDLAERTADGAAAGALLLEAADGWLAHEQLDAAVAALKAAVERSPRPQLALERLAAAARLRNQPEVEVAALRRRARLAVTDGEAHAGRLQAELGLRLLELGELAEARNLLSGALLLSPPDELRREALSVLAELAERSGDREEAAERLGQLADLVDGSRRAAVLVRRARQLVALERLEPAREALDAALASSPGDADALLALKELCLQLGDDEGHAEILQALLVRARAREEALPLALELGRVCRDRIRSADRAELAWRRALSLEPSNREALEGLFTLLSETGRLAEALPAGERLAALEPDARAAAGRLLALSRLALRAGERGLALRHARLAFERDGSDAETSAQLAEQLYLLGSTTEARTLLGRLAAQADFGDVPERARAVLLRYAELAAEGGHPGPAIEALRRVLDHNPADAAAADALFELLLPANADGAFDALARHAAALAPGRRAHALFLRLAHDARDRRRDPAAAAKFLEQARDHSEDPLPLQQALVEVHRQGSDRAALAAVLAELAEQAEESGESAIAGEALDELAAIRQQLGDVEGAASALERSVKLLEAGGDRAGCARRLRALGVLLRDQIGSPSRAEAAFRRAVELLPGDLEAAQLAAALIRQRGDAAGEAHLLERVLPAVTEPQARADALLHLARLYVGALGSHSRAEAVLEQLLALRPHHDEARHLLEELYEAQERWPELAASLELRAQTAPSREAQIAQLRRAAELYARQARDPARAARALLSARAIAPDDLDLAEQCAQVLADAGRLDEAAALDAELLAREPGRDAPFARQLAWLASRDDRAGRAALLERRADFEAPRGSPVAPERASRAARLMLEAAALRRALGDARLAAADEVRAFSLDPMNEESFAALLARADSTRDVAALAHVLSVRARAVPAEFVPLTRLRAEVLAADGRHAEAAAALDEVLAAAPDDAEALSLRGDVAFELAGLAAAAPFDRMLLARAGHHRIPAQQLAQAHYRLGLLAHESGSPELAADHLGEGLALSPEDGRSESALEALERIYAALHDADALHRTLLLRAERSADEASRLELLRRAADSAPGPQAALVPLEQLARLSPGDEALQDRLAATLEACGRNEQLVELLTRRAEGDGEPGRRAALLLRAAEVAQRALHDGFRARTLRSRARAASPASLEALRAVLPDLRSSGEPEPLAEALRQLIELSPDAEETAGAQLELARLLQSSDAPAAIALFLEVVRRGDDGRHFQEACEAGLRACDRASRPKEAAEILEAQAAADRDPRRAMERLLRAAALLDAAGAEVETVESRLQQASTLAPDAPEPLAALAALHGRRGRPEARAEALARQLPKLAPSARAALLRELAGLYTELGRVADALGALRAAVEANPDDAELRIALADALEQANDATLALEALERARGLAALDDVRRDALDRRTASLARRLGRDEDEARVHRSILVRRPGDDAAFAALRELLARGDARDELLLLLERREIALRERGDDALPERVELLTERARLLAALDRADEAEAVFRQALQLDPGSRAARTGLRELVAARGEPEVLCRALEAELNDETDPSHAFELALRLGETRLEALSDPAGAQQAFERARAHASTLANHAAIASAELGLSRALLASGEPAAARELLERGIAAGDGRDLELRRLAAEAATQVGDREAARRHLLAALEVSREPELLAQIEQLARDEGPASHADALELRARALEVGAPERAELFRRSAALWADAGDERRKRRALEAVLESEPLATDAFDKLLALHRREGRLDEVAGLLAARERQLTDPAEKARLLVELGGLLRGPLAQPARAAEALERALALEPGFPGAAEALAETSAQIGNAGRAEELYRRLLRQGSRIPAAELQLRLAELLERTDRQPEALALLELSARGNPALRTAHERLAQLAARASTPELGLRAREALLSAAAGTLAPERLAREHLEAARLCEGLKRPGEALRHYEAAIAADADAPEALARLAELYVGHGRFADAASVLSRHAEHTSDGSERGRLHTRRAELLDEKLAAPQRALEAVEAALADLPGDRALLLRGCRLAALLDDEARLLAFAEALETAGARDELLPWAAPLGRALASRDASRALSWLLPALDRAFDPELASLAVELARQTGADGVRLELEQLLVAALPSHSGDEAAARLQALANELEPHAPLKAAELLDEAFQFRTPDAAELLRLAALFEHAAAPDRAVRPLGKLVLLQPSDASLRQRLAASAVAAGQHERARLLATVETFFGGDPDWGAQEAAPVPVSSDARARLYEPIARGATAELLRLFAPALNGALGAAAEATGERIGPFRAPGLHARVTAAQRAVGLDALEALLAPDRGLELELVPGAPDRLVIGLGAATGLDGGAMQHLLVRACELSASGASLLRRDDAAELVQALLFLLGAEVEFPAALHALRTGLAAAVEPLRGEGLEPLAKRAAEERLEPAELLAALERSASRIALLVGGDAGAALRGELRLTEWRDAEPGAVDPDEALRASEAMLDLLRLATTEELAELRSGGAAERK